ncbi:MAG: D-alanyl-D-alanine carboxypeptidase [Lachnospiraceae bacterium]|nr:D-alanyl-D-alanine carboxypeptidase [Lachnospiraceae bacterium]
MKKLLLLLPILILLCFPISARATAQDYLDEAEERKEEPVQSNETPGWPQGPAIGAESAVLMDADTGVLLYAKNIDEHLYPASTTKLMTCLVAIENCPLNELITISQAAIDANESDGSHMYLTAGEQLTLEELLYGIIINSANEACNAVGEHIAGSMDAYVDMMNAKAAELGCTNTHFVTTNGLHDDDHYTSAHDLALIGRAFFSHEILASIACTTRHVIPETELHGEHNLKSKNKLYPGQEYEYDGLLGSKTGFTSKSRQTLVSCAQRGGIRLICVIMMEESPYQFTDTTELFDYGFSHFAYTPADELDSRFDISNSEFFNSSGDIFGNTSPLVYVQSGARILLPDSLSLDNVKTEVVYTDIPKEWLARVDYSYEGITLGSAPVLCNTNPIEQEVHISSQSVTGKSLSDDKVYVNIKQVLKFIIFGSICIMVLLLAIRLARLTLGHARRVRRIKQKREEVLKSRSTLRKNYHSSKHHPGRDDDRHLRRRK